MQTGSRRSCPTSPPHSANPSDRARRSKRPPPASTSSSEHMPRQKPERTTEHKERRTENPERRTSMCNLGHDHHANALGFLVDAPEIRALISETRRLSREVTDTAARVE